jgi:hypothetical protein
MEMRIRLGGSVICTMPITAIPAIGSSIRVRTQTEKKGVPAGSTIEVQVTNDQPPEVYQGGIVVIDANGYVLVEDGATPN